MSMWKRMQGPARTKDRSISNPVLLETTYDEDRLQQMSTIDQAQNADLQPNPHSLTVGHASALSPQNPQPYRASEVPTVSSIYSQESPQLTSNFRYPSGPSHLGADISPPSSPEPEAPGSNHGQPRRFRSMRDVSPVDESRGMRAVSPQANSSIPVLKKAPMAVRGSPNNSSQKFWGGKVAPNSKVKWDAYSGEPTSSNAGKAGQVNPHTFARESLSPPNRRPMGYQVSVSGPQDSSKKNATFSERANRFGSRPPPVDTSLTVAKPREPWSRASGRAEIVQPFKHQPASKPVESFRKASPLPLGVPAQGASSPATAAPQRAPARSETDPVATESDGFDSPGDRDDSIKPTVPLKVGANTPTRSIASPTSPNYPRTQTHAPHTALHHPSDQPPNPRITATAPTNNGGPGVKPKQIDNTLTPSHKVPRKSIEGTPASQTSQDHRDVSRFSWTTYNTSTTFQHSPPPSPPPPLPDARTLLQSTKRQHAPEKVPSRKPVVVKPSQPATTKMPHSRSPSPSSISIFSTRSAYSTSTQKALPRPPTEISAADHVDILEAQMDDLRVRRSNVYRLLSDLNNMAPPNPLITDFRRMRLVEQRKKDFEDELTEIKKEEHDVGLKLHRAWRKREKDDPGSESALWVRRVTR